ncbi:MAG: 16S rRNA (cytosine(967)-C(5))-methyltransferase RsmB [Gemmataceae bacterium]|nr:16S rRNA (cytosine(967)-C(5))-methyltransferase RsmB [Gemmataceae bacterium]
MKRVPHFRGKQHTARTLALEVLLACRQQDAFIQEVLDQHLGRTPLSAADRRLATQLAYGVLRRRGTLDALLLPLIQREPHKVEPWLWDTLHLGALQLTLLTHIPPHAAIHETVELAAQFDRPGAKGFLNGVLRSLLRLLTDERTDSPAADALPLEGGTYRRLVRPALPEPGEHPVEYLSAGFALPRWLVQRWLKRFGRDECLRLGFWFAGPAPIRLRCNTLRADREKLLAELAGAEIRAEAGTHPQAIRLLDPVPIRQLPGYEQGWFTVQDESAMRVGSALAPMPGSRVLDLCAAPGGKTTHLAELMRNEGRIIACDIDDDRLKTVTELCQRLGVGIVETVRLHAERNEEPPAGPFDSILVDVPCSNTGVLGRRPEVRWRLRPEDLRHLVALQTGLLTQAAERVRPGGVIVYSTCSVEPEENRQVVETVLQARPDLELEADEEQVPGRPADGGYWARLKRKEARGVTP